MPKILKQIHGRDFGLGPENELVVNQSGLGMAQNAKAFVESVVDVTITNLEMVYLYTIAKTLVPAPGANRVVVPTRMLFHKPAASVAWSPDANENIAIRWGFSSGTVMGASGPALNAELETATAVAETFLNSASSRSRYLVFQNAYINALAWEITGMADKALVLGMKNGEIGPASGTYADCAPLYVRTWYTIIPETLG